MKRYLAIFAVAFSKRKETIIMIMQIIALVLIVAFLLAGLNYLDRANDLDNALMIRRLKLW